jgi:membrane protease YdiL (CAAX protease family)
MAPPHVHELERPGAVARTAAQWPAWYAIAGLLLALAIASALGSLVALVGLAGGHVAESSPAVSLVSTLVQDVGFVVSAVFLASRVGTPSRADFGLVRAPRGRALTLLAAAAVAFYAFSAIYSAVVEPAGEQDLVETLGADRGAGYLLATGVVVVLVAPVAEEVLFRGFMYRALRNRRSVPVAAGVVALLFGGIHYSGPDTLVLLPVLVFLGLVFCLLYEWTGSLYPSIALHAVNNAVALAVETDVALAP